MEEMLWGPTTTSKGQVIRGTELLPGIRVAFQEGHLHGPRIYTLVPRGMSLFARPIIRFRSFRSFSQTMCASSRYEYL